MENYLSNKVQSLEKNTGIVCYHRYFQKVFRNCMLQIPLDFCDLGKVLFLNFDNI
jgi:hypothetical protein